MAYQPGTMRVIGLEQFLKTLDRLRLDVNKAGKQALTKVGLFAEGALKKRVSRTGHGRTYKTGSKTTRYKYHTASVPGHPPAVDTGRLRSSITYNVTGKPGNVLPNPGGGFGDVRAYVGTNVYYGYFLEMGTSKMAPRPWFYITIQANANNIRNLIANSLRDYIRRNARKK